MVQFDVEYVGDTPTDIQDTLAQINTAARKRTNEALMETARGVKTDLEKSSPVDTGEYRDSWYIYSVSYNEVWVLDSADHAQYVMLPNQRMVGSANADLPSQGILHDVKGVAKKHSDNMQLDLSEALQKMIQSFKK